MKTLYIHTITAALLGIALASSAVSQEQTNFPRERTSAGSCADVNWNENMLQNYPRLIDACQEVISVKGETWARFAANFVKINPNGDIVFNLRDRRDRSVEEVVITPAPGQVAYIDDRATPFSGLRTTDRISLYVPEGQYGFATQPGVPPEELATVVVPAEATDRTVAQRDTRPAMLPTTAGPLPWLALVGFLSMLGALGLTLRRWN